MSRREGESIVDGGEKRYRGEKEREIRAELFRKHQGDLEGSGAVGELLLKAKIILTARRTARRLSEQSWYTRA